MNSITPRQDAVDPQQREAPPHQLPDPLFLFQIVTFTVLILGVNEFARTVVRP